MIISIVILVLCFSVFLFWMTQYDEKVACVYSQPTRYFYLKYLVFRLIFWLRQRKSKQGYGDVGLGIKSKSSSEEMEIIQKLPSAHEKAVDAVYFNGGNSEGCFFVAATARRHSKLTQTICLIRIPQIGLLQLPSLPDTSLYREEEMSYAAAGLKIELKEPMRQWKISYKGKMRMLSENDAKEELDVEFDLEWLACTKYFDFDTDLDAHALSEAMAIEPWSRKFFKTLQEAHQTHYEQFGEITGRVNVEGLGHYDLKLQGVRDHSYGNVRDWSYFHRYAIQYAYLEDGTAICVGNICMPITNSRLIIGYIMHADGQMETVNSTDLQLYKVGESGDDPTEFEFNFIAGGKEYHLEGTVLERPVFYMGLDWESRIVERMCHYYVNGIKGWGISQFAYRNKSGKPKTLTD